MSTKITIIEDEKKLASSLKEGLEDAGYAVEVFYDAESAEKQYLLKKTLATSLIILDVMLPKRSGFEFCKFLRDNNVAIPVIILTALTSIEDKVAILDSGADDFISKPFSFDELLARIRAALRRPSVLNSAILSVGEVTLNPATQKVFRKNTEISLTLKEFQLLHYLMESLGKTVTREELLTQAWGMTGSDWGNVVDVHIRNLRKKIDEGYRNKIIRTVRGVGYSVEV